MTKENLERRKYCLHQMTNHLQAVDGFLEMEKPRQARLELKKAISCLGELREILRLDEERKAS